MLSFKDILPGYEPISYQILGMNAYHCSVLFASGREGTSKIHFGIFPIFWKVFMIAQIGSLLFSLICLSIAMSWFAGQFYFGALLIFGAAVIMFLIGTVWPIWKMRLDLFNIRIDIEQKIERFEKQKNKP